MKAKIEWLRVMRRSFVLAISACCLIGLSGCGDDDSGGGDQWRTEVTIDGQTAAFEINMPGDLSELTDGTYDLDGGSMTISGNQITIESYYSGMHLTMSGTIQSNTYMGGSLEGVYGGDTFYGTWKMYKL